MSWAQTPSSWVSDAQEISCILETGDLCLMTKVLKAQRGYLANFIPNLCHADSLKFAGCVEEDMEEACTLTSGDIVTLHSLEVDMKT